MSEPDDRDIARHNELLMAIGELSAAMGCPCVGGSFPKTVESQTVRLAAQRLVEYRSAASASFPEAKPASDGRDVSRKDGPKAYIDGSGWTGPNGGSSGK